MLWHGCPLTPPSPRWGEGKGEGAIQAVIPAPYKVQDKLQREFSPQTLDSPVSSTGQAYQVRNDK